MRILRRTRALVSLWVAFGLAIGLVGAPGNAGADPISFLPPVGTPIKIKFTNHESLVPDDGLPGGIAGPVGDVLTGVFRATSITSPDGLTTYWTPGVTDGSELNGFFTGLTVTAVLGGPVVTSWLTGGTATIYNVAAGTFAPGAGGGGPGSLAFPAGMLCPGGVCPAPWLTFDWLPLDGAGNTLITSTVAATGVGAGLTSWVTVTGGTAAVAFNNNAYVSPVGAIGDATIASTYKPCPGSPGCIAGWGYVSDDPIDSTVAPEPTTLLLWGTALAGLGIARRRFRARHDG